MIDIHINFVVGKMEEKEKREGMGGRMGAGGGGTRRGARVLGGARGHRRAIANDTARRAKKL